MCLIRHTPYAIENLFMKKFLFTSGLFAALSLTASAAPYVLPTPQPGALTPYDWQPTYQLEGLYGFASPSDIFTDMWGARLSLNLYSNQEATFRHQWSVNVAGMWGDETKDGIKREQFMLPITLGYDLNIALNDDILFYIDGKAGVSVGNMKWKLERTGMELDKKNQTDFTFLVGAGFKIIASDAIQIKAGYEYQRTYFEKTLGMHVISLGVGVTF